MSLFGSLYIGASGLQTSQNALNTTAHNMSNIDTVGYTRQQVQLGTRTYKTISKSASAISYQQTGLGVNYTQVKQVRDSFLDRSYRRESGRSAFYDTYTAAVEEVEDLFRELHGEAFGESIDNLWTSVQELAKDPGNPVNQSVFVQRCSEFLSRASSVYSGLCAYQNNLNLKIGQQVDTMNAYAKRITELNQEIMKIEAGKVEHANDLRDERNLLIDELSAMGNIECRTDAFGNILIRLEGKDFVNADTYNEIGLDVDMTTGFYTPYWKHLAKTTTEANGVTTVDIKGAELFNMTQTISTESNTDIGSLKAMMFARGTRHATFKDVQNEETYKREISQSIMMDVEAEFDQLIHEITLAINQVFADAAEKAKAINPDSTYMRPGVNEDPYTIFNTTVHTPVPEDPDDPNDPAYIDPHPDDFTIGKLIINNEIKQAPTLLGFKRDDEVIDQELADALKAVFEDEKYTVNPNVKTPTNFINYYNNMISLAGNRGNVFRGISENMQITVCNISAAREQILGVSSDEELQNMIMFQNAYNASSRYINVISELLEHIINTLGR